jgi:hypothetical protein
MEPVRALVVWLQANWSTIRMAPNRSIDARPGAASFLRDASDERRCEAHDESTNRLDVAWTERPRGCHRGGVDTSRSRSAEFPGRSRSSAALVNAPGPLTQLAGVRLTARRAPDAVSQLLLLGAGRFVLQFRSKLLEHVPEGLRLVVSWIFMTFSNRWPQFIATAAGCTDESRRASVTK